MVGTSSNHSPAGRISGHCGIPHHSSDVAERSSQSTVSSGRISHGVFIAFQLDLFVQVLALTFWRKNRSRSIGVCIDIGFFRWHPGKGTISSICIIPTIKIKAQDSRRTNPFTEISHYIYTYIIYVHTHKKCECKCMQTMIQLYVEYQISW